MRLTPATPRSRFGPSESDALPAENCRSMATGDAAVASAAVKRLWAKDESLWQSDEGEKRLIRKFELARSAGSDRAIHGEGGELARDAEAEGLRDVVFVAMGDSNLAAETLFNTSAAKRTSVFSAGQHRSRRDSGSERTVRLDRTLFVVVEQVGKADRDARVAALFPEPAESTKGSEPGLHFVAVTEEDSYLSELARNYEFLGTFLDPPGIKGRYSSLIHFGLLLSAIWRLDPQELVSRAKAMRELCSRTPTVDRIRRRNLPRFWRPARRRETTSCCCWGSKRAGFDIPDRAARGSEHEQGGQGLIPICDGIPRGGDVPPGLRGGRAENARGRGLGSNGIRDAAAKGRCPTVTIEMDRPEELGAEMFRWEIATALACVRWK